MENSWNCEVNLDLIWCRDSAITNSTEAGEFAITETKLYVPVVTLSTQDNTKLLQQLKSGFKRTINWNKYELPIKTLAQNGYLNNIINPSSQGVNRFSVLSFENEIDRISDSTYYLPKVEIKDYNLMIDGRNIFDHPINSLTKTYGNNRKIATGCLLDYSYFKENFKMIAIDLRKQQALDADRRAIQQINFTASSERAGGGTMFFIINKQKKLILISTRNSKSFVNAIPLSTKYSAVFISIKWHNTTI